MTDTDPIMVPHSHTATQPHSHTATHCAFSWFNRSVVQSLGCLLLVVEYLSLAVCLSSFIYHRRLYSGVSDFTTTEEYFFWFIPSNISFSRRSKLIYTTVYREYAHRMGNGIVGMPGGGCFVIHRSMAGVSFLIEDLIPSPNPDYIFCNLHNFSEVVEASNTKATPDSYYSVIILAISTFLWGAYLWVQVCLSKEIFAKAKASLGGPSLLKVAIYSLIFLLSIFGLYNIKKAKIDMDTYYVCLSELLKFCLIFVIAIVRLA